MDDKKIKSKNFSIQEEEELTNLVIKYWSIIQCKVTDHSNNLKKKEYWKIIENEFNNAISGSTECFRPSTVLKCKFENMMRRAQKKQSLNKISLTATGGGTSKIIEMSPVDERILCQIGRRGTGFIQYQSWCSDKVGSSSKSETEILLDDLVEEQVVGLEDIDPESDIFSENENQASIANIKNKIFVTQEEEVARDNKIGINCLVDDTSAASDIGSWAKYTPSMLRQPKANALCSTNPNEITKNESHTKKRKLLQDKLTLWAKDKVTLTNQRSEFEKKQLEFHMETWRKKLEREDLMKKEIEDRIKFQAQENTAKLAKYQAETELLRIQKTFLLKDGL